MAAPSLFIGRNAGTATAGLGVPPDDGNVALPDIGAPQPAAIRPLPRRRRQRRLACAGTGGAALRRSIGSGPSWRGLLTATSLRDEVATAVRALRHGGRPECRGSGRPLLRPAARRR